MPEENSPKGSGDPCRTLSGGQVCRDKCIKRTPYQSNSLSRSKRTAMRCPKCGNELSREEAFCGQCGAPTLLPVRPPEAAYPPAPRTGGLLRSYNTLSAPPSGPSNTNPAPPSSPYNIQPASPSNLYHPGMMPPTANSFNQGTPPPSQPLPTRQPVPGPVAGPGQPPFPPRPVGPHQPNNFYHDATEAMAASP